MIKRILSLIICLAIVVMTVLSVSARSLEEIQAEQEALEQQGAEYEALLNEQQAEVDAQQAEVDALVGKVETVSAEITLSHEKIAVLDEQIDQKQLEIDDANRRIEENMDVLRQRIKTIYLAGEVSSLEIILGAKDFSDFLDKVQLVKSVSAHDEELINEIQAQLDQIAIEKAELEEDKAKLEEEKANLEEKKKELNVLLEENKETLATLQEASNATLEQLTLTEDQLAQLDSELVEYYRQQQAQQQPNQTPGTQNPADVPNVQVPAGGGYAWPVPGFYYLSSVFYEHRTNYYHGGIDIAGGGIMGAKVVAAAGGTVVSTNTGCTHNWGKYYSCGCGGGYGNYVWINHGNGKETVYAHLSSVAVSTGQYVSADQYLGTVGTTGYSTGPHLHYECRYNGVKYDPMSEY